MFFVEKRINMKLNVIATIVLAGCVCSVLADSCTIGKLNQHKTEKVDFDMLVAKPQQFDKKWVSFTAVVRLCFPHPPMHHPP